MSTWAYLARNANSRSAKSASVAPIPTNGISRAA
jgi:hypothetical protein